MTAILHDEPPDAATLGLLVPAELGRIVRQCLAKSPNQRLQSARDLALALRATASDGALHRPPAAHPSARLRAGIAAITVLIGVGSASVYLLTKGSNHSTVSNPGAEAKASVRDQSIHSVAVLPFENAGGDPKTEFLSDGVADQIIDSLSQVRRRDLKVRPFTSVSRYKGQKPEVATVARDLNVQVVVTGTLHQSGDDLSIRIALVDAQEDSHLWGQHYQGKLGGILDLQDMIARDVASNLRLRLSGEEEKRLTNRYTDDPQAYLLYREAIYHFNKFTEKGLTTAIEYCEQAIQQDRKYVLAYAALGRCYILLGNLYRGPKNTYLEAKKYVDQALEIDEDLPDAHSALVAIYLGYWNWEGAEREASRALALDPNVLLTRNIYGFCLAAKGRLFEALASIRRGQELDPLAAPRRNELAMCYNWMRQYDEAIAEAQRALTLNPSFPLAYAELGLSHVQKKMYDEAIAELQVALDRGQSHPRVRGMLGYAYAAAGKREKAQTVLEQLKFEAISRKKYGFAFPIARIHAALGERDLAFAWLRKSCDERDGLVAWLRVDPTMDNLRPDPRFAQLLKDMGLPP
jgi:TolB-like protein/tetratricopeptide (TPR) repeat protein